MTLEEQSQEAPLLSVTVLNYNYGRYLNKCIESILAQTFRDFELIIIDDKSSDNSLEVIEPFLSDSRVRLIAHKKNLGFRESLIEGTERFSRGDLLMVISADDIVRQADAFERQVKLLKQNANATFCFSAYVRFDNETNGVFDEAHSYVGDRIISGQDFFREFSTSPQIRVTHSGTMIRRSAYYRVGGYRRDLDLVVDIAMWLVLPLEGDVAYCDEVLYGYRSHELQMTKAMQNAHKNSLECESAVETAFVRAKEKGLAVQSLREKALQYALTSTALNDVFDGRTRLALTRVRSAFALQPWLALKSKNVWVVIGRGLLGNRLYWLARAIVSGGRSARGVQ